MSHVFILHFSNLIFLENWPRIVTNVRPFSLRVCEKRSFAYKFEKGDFVEKLESQSVKFE